MRGSVNRLHQIAATLATKFDQVPQQVRCCIELVRTCDQDLQHLIQLRTDHAKVMTRMPSSIERIDSIIESARNALNEVCRIVENCRPEAHQGKTPFRKKLKWVLVDSLDFQNQLPVLNRHHAAVLAELNYVRQAALMALKEQEYKQGDPEFMEHVKTTPEFDILDSLNDPKSNLQVSEHDAPNMPYHSIPGQTSSSSIGVTKVQVDLEYTHSLLSRNSPESVSHVDTFEMNSRSTKSEFTLPFTAYCDEKEVVPQRQQQKAEGKRVVLASTDATGLAMLFDDDAVLATSKPL